MSTVDSATFVSFCQGPEIYCSDCYLTNRKTSSCMIVYQAGTEMIMMEKGGERLPQRFARHQ